MDKPLTPQAIPTFEKDLVETLPKLKARALALTKGDDSAADDLVQDTMVKAWNARHSFSPDYKMTTWLFTIMQNTRMDFYRRRKNTMNVHDDDYLMQLSVPPEQEHVVELKQVMEFVDLLTPAMREVLLASALGEDQVATARMVGTALGTVKSNMTRARNVLAKKIETCDRTPVTPGIRRPRSTPSRDA